MSSIARAITEILIFEAVSAALSNFGITGQGGLIQGLFGGTRHDGLNAGPLNPRNPYGDVLFVGQGREYIAQPEQLQQLAQSGGGQTVINYNIAPRTSQEITEELIRVTPVLVNIVNDTNRENRTFS